MSDPHINRLVRTLDELEARLEWAIEVGAEDYRIDELNRAIETVDDQLINALRELYG